VAVTEEAPRRATVRRALMDGILVVLGLMED
jgi:hypothetical protein